MDSLVLGDFGELIGDDSQGYVEHFEIGFPEAERAELASGHLDGSTVTGERANNAQVVLVYALAGDLTSAERGDVVGRLFRAVNQDNFALTWTPEGGSPVVRDCQRWTAFKYDPDYLNTGTGTQLVTMTLPALPYLRSPDLTSPTAGVSVLSLHTLDNTTNITTLAQALSTETTFTVSGGSIKQALNTGNSPDAGWQLTLGSAVDLSQRPVVQLMWAYSYSGASWPLTGSGDHRLYLSETTSKGAVYVRVSGTPGQAFAPLQFDIRNLRGTPSLVAAFNRANVRRLDLEIGGYTGSPNPTIYYDKFEAYPDSSGSITSNQGYIRYDGVLGDARTPVALSLVTASSLDAGWVLLHRRKGPDVAYSPILTKIGSSGSNPITATYSMPSSAMEGYFCPAVRVTWGASATPTGMRATLAVGGQTVETTLPTYSLANAPELIIFPPVTLPSPRVTPENVTATSDFTVQFNIASGGTGISAVGDMFLIDPSGETLYVERANVPVIKGLFVEMPDLSRNISRVFSSTTGVRTNATTLHALRKGAGIFQFDPGTNYVLLVTDTATSGATLTPSYYARHVGER